MPDRLRARSGASQKRENPGRLPCARHRMPAQSARASGGAMAEGTAGCEAEPRGPAGLGRSARGPGVCRVFADRRHMARAPAMWAGPRRPKIVLSAGAMRHAPPVRPAGRRLADSHLASPTAMHAVGPPPFPRRPEITSVRPAGARGLSRRGRPPWSRGARARATLGAMTQAWDKTLRARGYRVTPQRQLVLAAVTKLEHATPTPHTYHPTLRRPPPTTSSPPPPHCPQPNPTTKTTQQK